MASSEETARDIAELHRRSRRTLLIVAIGTLVVVASLGAAIWRINSLRVKAEQKAESYAALLRDVGAASVEPGQTASLLKQAAPLATQAATQSRPPQIPLEQVEVAIFVCHESSPANRGHSQALQRMRPASAGRGWPRNYVSVTTNAMPVYQLTRNEIRYNPAEEDAADRLQGMIRDSIGVEAAKVLTFFPSPNSVSVFFCDGANPPKATPVAATPPVVAN